MDRLAFPTSAEDADHFDTEDPLASARAQFDLPDGLTYLVGHSLGPMTRSAADRLERAAKTEWAQGLVGSWNSADWIDLPAIVGERLARLIGAKANEVTVCDSVSVNLFKLVGALIDREGMARRIVVEAGEFPTDQYILERLAGLAGAAFVRAEPGRGVDALTKGGVLVRSLVDYRSAAVADVEAVEAIARKAGGAVVWDLSHATGVLDLRLNDLGARYAVGCTYKYVNGGPGAPAFLYVRDGEADGLDPAISGWLGHARPFAFEPTFEPAPGVQRFVAGTPPILSMSALAGALDAFESVNLADLEAKAKGLGDLCLARFKAMGLESYSPAIGTRRGGHVAFEHPDGYAVSRALAEAGHKTDFRTPTTVRLGLSPLYLSYAQVWATLDALEEILAEETWRAPRFAERAKVT